MNHIVCSLPGAHESIQMCNMIFVNIAIFTARTVLENVIHGRLWYSINFLYTKKRSVMILTAINSKSMYNSKYITQKSDIVRNGETI